MCDIPATKLGLLRCLFSPQEDKRSCGEGLDCGSSRISPWLRGRWQRLLWGTTNEFCCFMDPSLLLPSEHGWSWRWAVPKPQAEPQLSSRLEFCLVWFLPSYKSSVTEVLPRSTSPSHGSILCQLCQERKARDTSMGLIRGQSCRISVFS